MRCVDVNVLVDAHRPESPRHDEVRTWLDGARRGAEPLAVPGLVSSGFLRVVTHPRVFREPSPIATALAFLEALHAAPVVTALHPGEHHWRVFADLCASLSLRGNDVADAYLAALVLEQGGTFVTSDRGFARFPGLQLEAPVRA
ncbi:MAG: TA system VapC family ribonuclease toxin [Acidimicrobiia bacterium]|nr:TA system VapC family ribonuclease toxin [Acidimicrobiia bacterium]